MKAYNVCTRYGLVWKNAGHCEADRLVNKQTNWRKMYIVYVGYETARLHQLEQKV